MLIEGSWVRGDDGLARPMLVVDVRAADGSWKEVTFLADSGADRTVIDAVSLSVLGYESENGEEQLSGIGGRMSATVVETVIRLRKRGGGFATFNGCYTACTEPTALDLNLLGRDILNHFAVIVDHPGQRVALVGQNHCYRIESV